MLTRQLLFGAIALATTFTFAATKEAQAEVRYALASITNKTKNPITYHAKWGIHGDWKKVVVQPGWYTMHSLRYDSIKTRYPSSLYIKFDNDLGEDRNKMKVSYIATMKNSFKSNTVAKQHKFINDGSNGRFIKVADSKKH